MDLSDKDNRTDILKLDDDVVCFILAVLIKN